MKKTLTDTGINGTFSGTVEVKLNYRTGVIDAHNPSTHEDYKKEVSCHIVVGEACGENFASKEFINENLVWQYIEEIEKKVKLKLHMKAKVPKPDTLVEQLMQKGYE